MRSLNAHVVAQLQDVVKEALDILDAVDEPVGRVRANAACGPECLRYDELLVARDGALGGGVSDNSVLDMLEVVECEDIRIHLTSGDDGDGEHGCRSQRLLRGIVPEIHGRLHHVRPCIVRASLGLITRALSYPLRDPSPQRVRVARGYG